MRSMDFYSKAAMERAMKIQEVILRALAKKITWWQAAEIIGISDRQMRRWHERLERLAMTGYSTADVAGLPPSESPWQRSSRSWDCIASAISI
jgi:cytochrome P450